jgi:hypothetical protein
VHTDILNLQQEADAFVQQEVMCMDGLQWESLPTEIAPKRKKGAKIDADFIR